LIPRPSLFNAPKKVPHKVNVGHVFSLGVSLWFLNHRIDAAKNQGS
jgi:hypothetical protein